MKKRADGRYMSQVFLGYDEDGRKKYKTIYAKSKTELKSKESEIRIKYNKGIDVTADQDTFGFWKDKWLILKKTLLTENQYNTYY